jgi:hypothetical protein
MSDSPELRASREGAASEGIDGAAPIAAAAAAATADPVSAESTSEADARLGDLCPYCGEFTERRSEQAGGGGTPRCRGCLAFLDPLSKQVTQSHMGPWAVRDTTRPFYPGVAFEVLVALISRGDVTAETVVRGPGTGQFWMLAREAPGIAHLVGRCHACGGSVRRGEGRCGQCGVTFPIFADRDRLGLPGASTPKRLSAFASDEELRAGAPQRPMQSASFAPAVSAAPAGAPFGAPIAMPMPRPQRDAELSPLEISLGDEIAHERRKTIWLMIVIAGLVVVNLAIAGWALLGGAGGGGAGSGGGKPQPTAAPAANNGSASVAPSGNRAQ